MRIARIVLGLALAGTAANLLAQAAVPQQTPQLGAPPPVTRPTGQRGGDSPATGRALFREKCVMCHGPGGMGTGLLARRVDPGVAELEKRTDLTREYVIQAARTGIGNMPAISRAEVSDAQIGLIAGYLAKSK